MKPFLLLISVFLIVAIGCRKNRPSTSTNQLPPATQEGKNTLGFMLNGQAWTPQGFYGTPNLSLYYDAGFQAGVFNLSAYRKVNGDSRQVLTMFGDSIQAAQRISLPNKTKFGFSYTDDITGCRFYTSDSSLLILSGYFDLKKLDKANHIFSGEFELRFKKTDCEEVQISQGRFDMKY